MLTLVTTGCPLHSRSQMDNVSSVSRAAPQNHQNDTVQSKVGMMKNLPYLSPPSRALPSMGWRTRICTGPRARLWILSSTMCFNLVRKENPDKIICQQDPFNAILDFFTVKAEWSRPIPECGSIPILYLSADPDPHRWNDSNTLLHWLTQCSEIRLRRIQVFGLPGPGSVRQRYGSRFRSFHYQAKIEIKNLYFYCIVTSLWLFKEWRKSTCQKYRNMQKIFFFFWFASWRSMTKVLTFILETKRRGKNRRKLLTSGSRWDQGRSGCWAFCLCVRNTSPNHNQDKESNHQFHAKKNTPSTISTFRGLTSGVWRSLWGVV